MAYVGKRNLETPASHVYPFASSPPPASRPPSHFGPPLRRAEPSIRASLLHREQPPPLRATPMTENHG